MNGVLKIVFSHHNLFDVAVKMTHLFPSVYVLAPTLPVVITLFFLRPGPSYQWPRQLLGQGKIVGITLLFPTSSFHSF